MLEKALARYIVALDDSAATTRDSDDKPLYEKYRAHAGLILALAILDERDSRLTDELEAHENLWVHSWLTDDAYQKPAAAWRDIADAWMAIKARL